MSGRLKEFKNRTSPADVPATTPLADTAAGHVGKDEDPIAEDIPHRYVFFPETGFTTDKAVELYQLLKRIAE